MPNAHISVVFDLDGTLIDSAPDLAGALNALLAEEDIAPVSVTDVRHMVGEGAVKLIERGLATVGRELGEDQVEPLRLRFLAHYEQMLTATTQPYPGVVDALELLATRGCPLAVCTNKPEGLSHEILAELDLARFFGAVIGGDTLPTRKPDPAPLAAAVGGAGGRLTRAVMVGDSSTDVCTARAAGVPIVLVSFGYTRIPPGDLGADALIDHFDQLLATLESVGNIA